jgi:hypothetical protein
MTSLVASLADIAPAAPHIAPMQTEGDHPDMAGHLADNHFAILDTPAHMADRVAYLVAVTQAVDSTGQVVVAADSTGWVVVAADSTDWVVDNSDGSQRIHQNEAYSYVSP